MDSNYDENLNDNAFLKYLRKEYETVFQKAIYENWLICVPCAESLDNYELNQSNVLTHVLVPNDELPETHFHTLNEQEVKIYDKQVRLENVCHDVPILFTETYYLDENRYQVLCLERPLNFNVENCRFNLRVYPVKNLRDCIDLLLLESADGTLLVEKLDEIIKQFLFLSSKDYFTKTLEQQVGFIKNIYNRCLQITLCDKKIAPKVKINATFMGNVKVSVESYVLHNMCPIIMKGLITNMTHEIGVFNKSLRNLANIQLQHLNVSDSVLDSIPKARNELSRINGYSTVLGKLICFKRCINLVSKSKYRGASKLTVDELLPILVFLVVKSGIITWKAQLKYAKEFSFSQADGNHADELGFLLSTLEAVLTYIHSDSVLKTLCCGHAEHHEPPGEECAAGGIECSPRICPKSRLFWKTKNPFLLKLFRAVYHDDLEEIASMLESHQERRDTGSQSQSQSQFCHPLCSCDRCEKLQTSNSQQTSLTVNSANDSGCGPLQVAACYGKSAVVDWLLSHGANPNCNDFSGSTALHCAAAHGHQNAVLLLLYADGKIEQRDGDGNQALHFAAINGHVDCVKALLYFAEHAGIRYDVNGVNKDGDTPLHLAAKYCYKDIADILMAYNANPSVKNKHGSTVFELTESLLMKAVLSRRPCAAVNLLNVPLRTPSVEINELEIRDEVRLLPNAEYGVRPQTAECIKNADKLLKAAKTNDLSAMKRYLGFSGVTPPDVPKESCPSAAAAADPVYKCHPLCRCEKCSADCGTAGGEDEADERDDFDKIDALSANICDSDGFTALHVACKYGRAELIRFLLDVGAKINVRTYKQLLSPLHVACLWNQPNAAKILLDCGTCKIDLPDRNGSTALHYACSAGNARIVQVLLKFEPDTEAKNDKGKTPLNEAEESLSFAVMRLLKMPAKHEIDNEIMGVKNVFS